jgi:SpoIID/LytB domain protein
MASLIFRALVPATLIPGVFLALPAIAQADNVDLQIGIIQRFGDKKQDTLTLTAQSGDKLTVRFSNGDGKTQTLTTDTLKLETVMQPLSKPRTDERVIFSEHRSFETAEEQALYWKNQGIDVEIAQPNRWQVWGKRSSYKTPMVRRWLVNSLKERGISVRLDSKTVTEVPKPSFVINGNRYTRDRIDISSGSNLVYVDRDKDDYPKHLFPGRFRLQPNAHSTTTLVNVVPLETYLRGVVPYEIGQGAPFQAMSAQAILARTYVLRNVRRFTVDNYQLCATTQCQVYFGLDGTTAETDRAIAETQGKVLTYNNELVDALYSSTTGGVTAAFTDVWQGQNRPYLKVNLDAANNVWDLNSRPLSDEQNLRAFLDMKKGFNESEISNWFRWKNEASLETMNKDFRKYLTSISHPMSGFTTIQNVQVTGRSTGGRASRLSVLTDAGQVDLDRDEILLAFEAPNSLLFYLDPKFDASTKLLKGFTFTGGGLGHAVGLSQFGSYNLGKLGWNYDRILGFYFPSAQLQPYNTSITTYRETR